MAHDLSASRYLRALTVAWWESPADSTAEETLDRLMGVQAAIERIEENDLISWAQSNPSRP